MSNETPITVVGRLTEDPEMRFTPSGAAVVNVSIACNERRFNKDTNEWDDGTPVFWRGSAWREMAERIAGSLHQGDAVVAYGFVQGRTWNDKETGKARYASEISIQAIGPDLRWMEVTATKAQRGDNQRPAQPAQSGWGGQQADPWANPGGGNGPASSNPADSEPPFQA